MTTKRKEGEKTETNASLQYVPYGWTICTDFEIEEQAHAIARGSYQLGIIYGNEALACSTLKGKAAKYGGHYADSRNNLLRRLTQAGIVWREARVRKTGKRLLVLGHMDHQAWEAGE